VKALLAVAAAIAVAAVNALASQATATATATATKQLTVSGGDVKATLTYSRDSSTFGYKTEKLTITRAGRVLYDDVPHPSACHGFACGPTVGFGPRQPPLVVRDLDGDGEPEVVYSAYTGGAHCCSVGQFFSLAGGGKRYSTVDRLFGDPGFGIEDLNRDGRPEVVTADDAFAYRFTFYAASGLPLLVLRFDHGRFAEITRRFPGRLRREAAEFWRTYKKIRKSHDDSPRGQISAWAADEYRLGRRKHALAVLRGEVRSGFLAQPGGGAKFIRTLDRFLRQRGYAR
jgi:hypothetical protein